MSTERQREGGRGWEFGGDVETICRSRDHPKVRKNVVLQTAQSTTGSLRAVIDASGLCQQTDALPTLHASKVERGLLCVDSVSNCTRRLVLTLEGR